MNHLKLRVTATFACASTLLVLAGAPTGVAAAAGGGGGGQSDRSGRIAAYWTMERRAAAQPRDLLLDAQGRAYLRLGNGALQPYGRELAGGPGTMVPNAKPGGGGGGGGSGDTVFPVVGSMSPGNGDTIGAGYTFSATVTDNVGLRSVTFSVRKGSSRTQSFSASPSGDTWTVSLSGFSDGDWSWYVVAKDTSGNTTTSSTVAFKVDTSGGGGGGSSSGDVVTNAAWTDGGTVQTAAGRIYFEMPSNAKRTRWAGYVCSGTVVTDGMTGRSVIQTAAHCVYDDSNKAFARNVLFIPNQAGTSGSGTDLNCSNDPMGCWTPSFGVVDVNWTTRTFPDNIAWDYAYYVVSDSGAHSGSGSGGALDGIAGSMPLSFIDPAHDDGVTGATSPDYTRALGYSYSDDPNFMYCAEDMTTEGTANWWLPSCGLSGGASGGPWLQKSSSGYVLMSVNSWGYTSAPGMAGPKLWGTSASCVFDAAEAFPFDSVPTSDGDAGDKVVCQQ
jgi:hypothetical protein